MGSFKVKCLTTPMDDIRADRESRELLGNSSPMTASPTAANLTFALSKLKYRIIEMPPFWENRELGGSHIEDHEVIYHILDKAIEAEEQYLEEKNTKAKEIEERIKKAMKNKDLKKEAEIEKVEEDE